jgi:ABC-type glycerol-3-phosphate transport system permease component
MPIIPEIGRKHIRVRLLLIGITSFLWIGVLLHLFPVWWMISTSLKTTAEIYANPIGFVPQEISFASYKLLFGSLTGSKTGSATTNLFKYPMTLYIKNSLMLAMGVLCVQIPSTLLLAYATSRLHTNKIKQGIFYLCVATMMIPAQVKMVPSFLLLSHFPWPTDYIPNIPFTSIQFPSVSFIGSFWGVILPVTFNSYNFLLLKNFFDGIDKEYIEAARIDGCSEINIITQIMLPLARPIIAFTCYVSFVNSWNNFMGPWIILQNVQEKWPLAVVVFQLQQFLVNSGATAATSEASEALRASGAGYNALMALALIECIPVMLLFMFFREQIMKGVKMKGLKA